MFSRLMDAEYITTRLWQSILPHFSTPYDANAGLCLEWQSISAASEAKLVSIGQMLHCVQHDSD
jgi:hypothetical protein